MGKPTISTGPWLPVRFNCMFTRPGTCITCPFWISIRSGDQWGSIPTRSYLFDTLLRWNIPDSRRMKPSITGTRLDGCLMGWDRIAIFQGINIHKSEKMLWTKKGTSDTSVLTATSGKLRQWNWMWSTMNFGNEKGGDESWNSSITFQWSKSQHPVNSARSTAWQVFHSYVNCWRKNISQYIPISIQL